MPPGRQSRRIQGETAHYAGLAAEEIVAGAYAARGMREVARRWRGAGGEIDLIFGDGEGFVFVEVKRARTHDLAAQRLSERQLARICLSAEDYLGRQPQGSLTGCRVDLALVDGQGRVQVIENITQ